MGCDGGQLRIGSAEYGAHRFISRFTGPALRESTPDKYSRTCDQHRQPGYRNCTRYVDCLGAVDNQVSS